MAGTLFKLDNKPVQQSSTGKIASEFPWNPEANFRVGLPRGQLLDWETSLISAVMTVRLGPLWTLLRAQTTTC